MRSSIVDWLSESRKGQAEGDGSSDLRHSVPPDFPFFLSSVPFRTTDIPTCTAACLYTARLSSRICTIRFQKTAYDLSVRSYLFIVAYHYQTQPCGDGRRERAPPPRAAAHNGHGCDRPVHRGVHVEVRQRRVDRGAIHGVQRVDIPVPGHAGTIGGPGPARGKPNREYVSCRAAPSG